MSPSLDDARVLIFIVAYEAAETIVPVLERIPADLPAGSTEILIIDDASDDQTFEKALNFVRKEYKTHPVTVLKNPRNQGYGGNQKLGFRYAIDEGFDYVVLLHGDGQYAPESIPALLEAFAREEADAVFGSRMLSAFGALKGGMPLYKYVGNKILTKFQNHMLRSNLSEFHSGYRAYRVSALESLPFEANANVFHFDTEIIIQFLLAKHKIIEIPIPTYYGDEICRVNGIKYAWDVIISTINSRLQELCLCFRRKFDVETTESNERYRSKLDFPSSHLAAASQIHTGTHVFDIGCGPGHFAAFLHKTRECRVTGVDRFPPATPAVFEEFIEADLDRTPIPPPSGKIDVVIALDLIEHLAEPEKFLRNLAQTFQERKDTQFVFSTPNVAFLLCRVNLFFGRFNYGKRGILDLTHKRLFTLKTFRIALEENGFEVLSLRGVPPPVRLVLPSSRVFGFLLEKMALLLCRLRPALFAFQSMAVCRIIPTTRTLLEETKHHSMNKQVSSRSE